MRLGDLWESCADGRAFPGSDMARGLFVLDITADSREVRFSMVFCAITGQRVDGLSFCAKAAAQGAQAIVVPDGAPDDALGLSDYEREKIVVLRVADPRIFYARALALFHNARPATLAAVTGTNGKTSTVSFLRDLWGDAGHTALSLGTLGLRSHDRALTDLEAGLTTFDPRSMHLILAELQRRHGITHLALEASSHALDQERLRGLAFEAAAFTNLTQDHLDYHGDMESYFQAKARLFRDRLRQDGVAVINRHDPYGQRLAAENSHRMIGYGTGDDGADLMLLDRTPHERGQSLTLSVFGTRMHVEAPVAGLFQAENILCALGLAIGTGMAADRAVAAVSRLQAVPGRLEMAAALPNGAAVYVDYAHTPDALDNVLRSMRPHVGAQGRLHVLFGCGGDRDVSKRPQMGRIASERADMVWVTDDNPRSENAAAIRAAIIASAPDAVDAGDRRAAIGSALSAMQQGDILVVAGKGHEDYQMVARRDDHGTILRDDSGRVRTVKEPFSDLAIIRILAGVAA